MEEWQKDLRRAVETREELAGELELLPEEEAWFGSGDGSARRLPLRITRRYLDLIRADSSGALRRMAVPAVQEGRRLPCESEDPLAETRFEASPRVIHRYRDRVLVLTTDVCALYCRHCFRRRFTADGAGSLGRGERTALVNYLEQHPEVHEVILSGGDPLLLGDEALDRLLSTIRTVARPLVLRLSTRTPAVLPSRATEALAALLAARRPLWLVLQINHPAELDAAALRALSVFSSAGIPLLSQTVLLRGVNDGVEVLRSLFYALAEAGVKPYYLFQGDLAAGTSHLRTPLGSGLALYAELQESISSLALPAYAVDLPDGGGKVRLDPERVGEPADGFYMLKGTDGRLYPYPAE